MGRGKAKPKKPFWKKQGPEMQRIYDHLGKFADRLSLTDVMNLAAFGASSYMAYTAIKGIEKAEYPLWLEAVTPMFPVAYIWKNLLQLSTTGAKMLTEEQKIAAALIAGYATLKLPGVVVQGVAVLAKP